MRNCTKLGQNTRNKKFSKLWHSIRYKTVSSSGIPLDMSVIAVIANGTLKKCGLYIQNIFPEPLILGGQLAHPHVMNFIFNVYHKGHLLQQNTISKQLMLEITLHPIYIPNIIIIPEKKLLFGGSNYQGLIAHRRAYGSCVFTTFYQV